jgi:hypothetical protein
VTPTFLAPGPHAFAPLPGGLRRSAKTRASHAVIIYRRAVGDGSATRRDGRHRAISRRQRAWHRGRTCSHRCRAAYAAPLKRVRSRRPRLPPSRRRWLGRKARAPPRSDGATPTCLATGPHVFAPLPGGLRRSAKTRAFTAVLVYRRAVGDGWAAKRERRHGAISRRQRAWHRGRTRSHRCRAAYAAPLKRVRSRRPRLPPSRRRRLGHKARAPLRSDFATPTCLAPGPHVFAPLPGGLRRSAKTRAFPPYSFTAEP